MSTSWRRQNATSTFQAGKDRTQCQHSKLEHTECNANIRSWKRQNAMSNVRNWKRQNAVSASETGRDRVQCQRSKLEETKCSVSVRHQKRHTATSTEPCCKTDHKVLSELDRSRKTDHLLPPLGGSQNSDTSLASGR